MTKIKPTFLGLMSPAKMITKLRIRTLKKQILVKVPTTLRRSMETFHDSGKKISQEHKRVTVAVKVAEFNNFLTLTKQKKYRLGLELTAFEITYGCKFRVAFETGFGFP